MDVNRRRRVTSGVVAGSVWESRMKLDEFKVFNSEENSDENNTPIIEEASTTGLEMDKKVNLRPKQSVGSGMSGKRKTWKTESSEGNPIRIARERSELSKNVDEQCKELSVSADGMMIKKSPIQMKKTRSDASKELSTVSVDGVVDKSPVKDIKARSLSLKGYNVECSNASEKSPIQLRKGIKSEGNKALLNEDGNEKKNSEQRKAKTEPNKAVDDQTSDGNVNNSLQLVRAKSVSSKVLNDDRGVRSLAELRKEQLEKRKVVDVVVEGSNKNLEMADQGIDKNPIGIKRTASDENCKVFGVCEEKIITSNFSNVGQAKSAPKSEMADGHRDGIDNQNDVDGDDEDWDEVLEEVADEETEVEIEKKSLVVKEINSEKQKPKKVVVIEEKKHQHSNERPLPISPIVKKQPPPVVSNVGIYPSPTKTKTTPVSEEFHRIPRKNRRLQNLVDLVMWKDVSRSAFIFGLGTFFIITSSYTQDLNISIISVFSYLGLVYLAAIFLFRSLIRRGATDIGSTSQDHVVGEDEAIWLIKLILPYVNEFFLNLRALFSGDPATTMKMAVLLFVLARCGSSITIWKMAKLGFFGVFILPKVYSSYSTQITAYGTFWIRRFRDAWESCTHKKAVAFGVFTLVWNLSSIVARIWAVFMLFVAFKYYQQSLMRREWEGDEEAKVGDSSWQGQMERQRKERRSTLMETRKPKKAF